MNFDPNEILNQNLSGGFSTRVKPVPPGEYPAIVKSLAAREVDSKQNPGQKQLVIDVVMGISDAGAAEATGRPEPTSRLTLWVDRNATGQIDRSEGKNIGLGRLLEALELNIESASFSFNDLIGRPLIVVVENTPDRSDPTMIYDNVKRVAKL